MHGTQEFLNNVEVSQLHDHYGHLHPLRIAAARCLLRPMQQQILLRTLLPRARQTLPYCHHYHSHHQYPSPDQTTTEKFYGRLKSFCSLKE
jgi:hypothetical protein